MTLDWGKFSLRERTEARDQLIAPTTKASAPELSMGASPKLTERLTRTATPARPTTSAIPRRRVRRCVRRMRISSERGEDRNGGQHDRSDPGGDALLGPEDQSVVHQED